jgi:5-formyltetrahydrofolate cyclo-ligase
MTCYPNNKGKMVTDRILSTPEYQTASNVSVYVSLPTGEVNTRELIKDALEQGNDMIVESIKRY